MATDTWTITRPASDPDADLACDFTVAKQLAGEGFREQLARLVRPPIVQLTDGVRVEFDAAAWDAVRRYVDVESVCCPFLSLSAECASDRIVLTVTGRPEARDLIANIFSASSAACGDACCS